MNNTETKTGTVEPMRQYLVVRSRRIAWLLRKDGYQIEKVEPNKFKPEFDVYKFRAVPGIREDFVRHVKEMHERKMYKAS